MHIYRQTYFTSSRVRSGKAIRCSNIRIKEQKTTQFTISNVISALQPFSTQYINKHESNLNENEHSIEFMAIWVLKKIFN